MKRIFLICTLLLLAGPCMAQGTIPFTLAWDPSTTASTTDNPVNYKIYKCTDSGLTSCTPTELGRDVVSFSTALSHQQTAWYYVKCWNLTLLATNEDGTSTLGSPQESGRSNVLQIRAFAPPGNPSRHRLYVALLDNKIPEWPLNIKAGEGVEVITVMLLGGTEMAGSVKAKKNLRIVG